MCAAVLTGYLIVKGFKFAYQLLEAGQLFTAEGLFSFGQLLIPKCAAVHRIYG
ncbi:hypothetical protein D3C75_1366950 [compost metagenome]